MTAPNARAPSTAAPAQVPAVIFPGQGVAAPVLAQALAPLADHSLVRTFLTRREVRSVSDLDLTDTRVTQPVIYLCGLINAFAAAGEPAPDGPPRVRLTAGHSLGELTAVAYAGGITAEDGLELAMTRGVLFHEAQTARPGAMAVLMGLDLVEAEWLRRTILAEHGGVLEIANVNSERQIVLSGDVTAVETAITYATRRSALAYHLPVGAAAHSPLMAHALRKWEAALAEVDRGALRIPVVSGIDGRAHQDTAECVELIAHSLLLPVHWPRAVAALQQAGSTAMWDAGPGTVLHNLARRIGLIPCIEEFPELP